MRYRDGEVKVNDLSLHEIFVCSSVERDVCTVERLTSSLSYSGTRDRRESGCNARLRGDARMCKTFCGSLAPMYWLRLAIAMFELICFLNLASKHM